MAFARCWRLISALALAGLVSAPAQAGAWTKRKHEGLFISGLGMHWLEPAVQDTAPDRLKREAFVYFEFGMIDRITLQGRGAYQEMHDLSASPADMREPGNRQTQSGFGGLELGIRYRLADQGRWTSSLQMTAGIPGSGENWNNEGFGVGGGDLDTRLQLGRSVGDDSFVEMGVGFRARRGGASDEVRIDLSAGRNFIWGSELMVQSYSVWALSDQPARPAYFGHRLQTSLLVPLRGESRLQISALTTVAQKNMSRETAVMLSIWNNF